MAPHVTILRNLGDNAIMATAVERGFPAEVALELGYRLGISQDKLSAIVQIPKRTLHRRIQEKEPLKQDESERVWRLFRLYQRAVDVFENEVRAREWFASHPRALGGETPLEFAQTEPGAREVENLLGRIEHGVFG
jgi:putative toxin-antitoxin system antitoxin component (TIGR02293 family)